MKIRLLLLCCCLHLSVNAMCGPEEFGEERAGLLSTSSSLPTSGTLRFSKDTAASSARVEAATKEKERSGWRILNWAGNGLSYLFGKPNVPLEFDPRCKYWAKRWLHIKAHQFLYASAIKQSEPLQIPTDQQFGKDLISWNTLTNSGIPVDNIFTGDIPSSEKSFGRQAAVWGVYYLRKFLPLAETPGLPPIPADPKALLQLSFSPEHVKLQMPVPQLQDHMMYDPEDIVGGLAIRGPYAGNIAKSSKGAPAPYVIDFTRYEKLPVKEGLEHLGGKAYLKYNHETKRMETQEIIYDGKRFPKGCAEWPHIQSIFLMSQASNGSLVEHLFHCHMYLGGTFAAVNNKTLSRDHPLRILMHPHQHLTLSVNNYQIILLLGAGQFVPRLWSYDSDTVTNILNSHTENFDISSLDFLENVKRRGFRYPKKNAFPYPHLENMGRLWTIISEYVSHYIDDHYCDEDIARDTHIQNWYEDLERYVPNGIKKYAGDVPSKEGLKKLITTFIYTVSVKHQDISNTTFNYSVWLQYLPHQVRKDGILGSIGNHQEYVNTALVATAPSPVTFEDDYTAQKHPFSRCLSVKQKKWMRWFHAEMQKYQEELNKVFPTGLPLDLTVPNDVGASVDA